ncbi:MAG: rod shape-determining protein MreC [Deltaproteobacteria bacterium]|nr:MAG: rod shape-determining protein MreC [Deltaproteobacteria bacterium]
MRSLLRRYREPVFVAFLLALPFAIFAAKARKPMSHNLFDRAVLALTAPVEKAIVMAVNGVQDAWHGYVALRGVREENLRLRRDVLHDHNEASALFEVKAENERLKRLLEYADRQSPTRYLVAEVIAVGASPHSHVLRIARGTADGVAQGAPVVAPEGVVGQVAVATAHYADVQLILSPTSAVPAVSQRTRGRSTVKGVGDFTRCKLEYALRTDDLQDGDLLLTAGGPGFFPKGLPIGRVVNVAKRPTGMFTAADVVPAVSFSRLDEVMVVLGHLPPPSSVVNASTIGAPQ